VIQFGRGNLETATFALDDGSLIAAIRQGDLCVAIACQSDVDQRAQLAAALHIPLERTIVTWNGVCSDGKQSQKLDGFMGEFRAVDLSWGCKDESGLTVNQKGRWGSRKGIGKGEPIGVVDPKASVIRLDDSSGAPRLLLAHFTGKSTGKNDFRTHTAVNFAASFQPDVPQVMLLQGCTGDVVAKGGKTKTAKADAQGSRLAKSLLGAAIDGHVMERPVMGFGEIQATLRTDQGSEKYPIDVLAFSQDIALVFLPAEPFVGVGLTIRERSPFKLTIPVAWSNAMLPCPIPQGKDLADEEYLAAFPQKRFVKPAGDMLVLKALELLIEIYDEYGKRYTRARG
jgi:hypothetical protein